MVLGKLERAGTVQGQWQRVGFSEVKRPSIKRLCEMYGPEAVPDPACYGARKGEKLTDVNQLIGKRSDELQTLFSHGRAPDPSRFSGEMRGVALNAPHHDDSGLGRFVRGLFAKAPPWRGKIALSTPSAGEEGTGKNRIFGGLLCPFRWGVVDSELDKGSKVIRLDYATPKSFLNNITAIDAVHDEIREVGAPGSGVYLGMAALKHEGPVSSAFINSMLKLAGREERVKKGGAPVPLIYFALQAAPK
jgi:hypothetical protein